MKLTIKNFRGIAAADINLSGVTLLCGKNGSGKTSVAMALAGVLQRNAAPVPGMTKAEAREYLRDHQDRGKVVLSSEGGTAQANYPGATTSIEGQPPMASAMACGLLNIATMSEKARAAYLIEAMQASPTRDDLASELGKIGVGLKAIDSCWEKISTDGWDKTHAYALSRATEAKGAWQQITGERWGSLKAVEWRPSCLPPGEFDAQAISANVEDQRKKLEQLIANKAVNKAELERLEELANQKTQETSGITRDIAVLEKEREIALNRSKELVGLLANARNVLASLPAPGKPLPVVSCPSCGDHLVFKGIDNGTPCLDLASKNQQNDAEKKSMEDAIHKAKTSVKNLEMEESLYRTKAADIAQPIAELNSKIKEANKNAQLIENAKKQLNEAKKQGSSDSDIQEARDHLLDAEQMLAAAAQFYDAAKKHQAIESTLKMADVLAPGGLRQKVLQGAINKANEKLADLCQKAKWGVVSISEELVVHYAGRRYDLLSAAEQFRAKVSLQLIFSDLDGSGFIVVDAADILDKQGRSGLVAMLISNAKPALVTMTMSQIEDVPDLSKSGKGQSYWAADATIKPVC
jgi:energy-coupling factor transporter ATP-binding protein EcfA2